MQSSYGVLHLENKSLDSEHVFALDVLEGLSAHPKTIPSKHLYDEHGSRLFHKITELDDYYQFRCELEVLEQFKHQILQMIGKAPFRLIELGVGDGRKTRMLLRHFLDQGVEIEYFPIDYCSAIVSTVVESLKQEFSGRPLKVVGMEADYFSSFSWLEKKSARRNVVLFLGSSIGNLDRHETEHLLHHMWNSLNQGDLVLIGFDLKKDISVLERAYNDSAGITRAFNINLLNRMNRELNAHFNPAQFKHYSFYNPGKARMESWIISKISQTIEIEKLQKEFSFEAWEGVHVENSYKYDFKNIADLALCTDFLVKREMVDAKGYFTAAILEVHKDKIG